MLSFEQATKMIPTLLKVGIFDCFPAFNRGNLHAETFPHCVRDCHYSINIWHHSGFNDSDFSLTWLIMISLKMVWWVLIVFCLRLLFDGLGVTETTCALVMKFGTYIIFLSTFRAWLRTSKLASIQPLMTHWKVDSLSGTIITSLLSSLMLMVTVLVPH